MTPGCASPGDEGRDAGIAMGTWGGFLWGATTPVISWGQGTPRGTPAGTRDTGTGGTAPCPRLLSPTQKVPVETRLWVRSLEAMGRAGGRRSLKDRGQ